MPAANYQTVTLRAGSHPDPSDGVCVMELSSLLERGACHTRPRSVCPGLVPFLWGYNDTLGHELRQGLRGLAVDALDTRAPEPLTQMWADYRADACLDWVRSLRRRRLVRLPWGPRVLSPRRGATDHTLEVAGRYAGRLARRRPAIHAATMEFLAGLCEVGRGRAALSAVRPAEPVWLSAEVRAAAHCR